MTPGLLTLNLATQINSPDHYAKGTRSHISRVNPGHSAPTGCRHTVSGSISLPSRGSFHLSLTVLVHYRWQMVFSLTRWSWQIHTGFLVSRVTWVSCREDLSFSLTGLSPSMAGLSMPFS